MYVDLLPPCNAGCPAGENIQAWLAHMQAGEHELAWRALVADNPFAAIHGRVCYHPCESVCNRASLDSAVSIHSVERFLGDLALERGWLFDPPPVPSGKRVLVIGAGPSGLSAAYHLARLGHEVEIRDAGSEPGGMMRYGIPAYRMPRDVLERGARADRGARRADHQQPPGRGSRRRAARGRFRRRVRRGRRAPVKAGGDPRHGCGADRGCGVVPARRRVGRAAGDRAPRRDLWRRQHGDGRRADGAPVGRGGDADRLPPHARADAGTRGGGAGRRARGGSDQLAADDQDVRGSGAEGRGDGARRFRVPAADRAV